MEVAWFADMTGSEMCKWNGGNGGNEGKRRKGNVGCTIWQDFLFVELLQSFIFIICYALAKSANIMITSPLL